MGQSAYRLPLNRGQADHLLLLVSIGQLAIAEHDRSGWLPAGATDAKQMTQYLQALRGTPSLAQPMAELGAWLRQGKE